MEELLTHLINKTKYDCEEAHRRIVFASTGLAGLYIIKEQVHNDSCVKAFTIAQTNNNSFGIDLTQNKSWKVGQLQQNPKGKWVFIKLFVTVWHCKP